MLTSEDVGAYCWMPACMRPSVLLSTVCGVDS